MNIFDLKNNVIEDYREFIESFIQIKDGNIKKFVKDGLRKGYLWPDSLIQLNSSYASGKGITELISEGLIDPLCEKIFQKNGSVFSLYYHQEQAIRKACSNEHYILTTGTGSGKSLAYFLPIVDSILKNNPSDERTRAIIIYPMNALINSQENEINELLSNLTDSDVKIKVSRYTGQDNEDKRQELLAHPPHILLTNYMMLELMMSRRREEKFINKSSSNIQFLVLDELHTYTGRQGADVSMLVRRVRQRCGNPNLLCIGTSATMVSEGNRNEQRSEVARVGSTLFGVNISSNNVIDEKIEYTTTFDKPITKEVLLDSFSKPIPSDTANFINHPFSRWIEDTYGIEKVADGDDVFFKRKTPISLSDGAEKLSNFTDLDKDECKNRIKEMLYQGSKLFCGIDNRSIFAVRSHQFISQGGSVYSSLDTSSNRVLTLDGKNRIKLSNNSDKLLYPLLFCRNCGQEHYQVKKTKSKRSSMGRWDFIPLILNNSYINNTDDDEIGDDTDGYLVVEDDENNPMWSYDDIPDNWYQNIDKRKLKKDRQGYEPIKFYRLPDGSFSEIGEEDSIPVWFIRKPLLVCTGCKEIYDKRASEFRKLAVLSSEGRSTATTLLTILTVTHMEKLLREENGLNDSAELDDKLKGILKVLSFTDNRQDASLQSGHYNDFVYVALLRNAIYKALTEHKKLKHYEIDKKVIEVLNLDEDKYAIKPGNSKTQSNRNMEALIDYVRYKIFEDLKRGWRITLPNLEHCGLLKINYDGLDELCKDEDNKFWEGCEILRDSDYNKRYDVCYQFLTFLRDSLAINYDGFTYYKGDSIKQKVNNVLKEPWNFEYEGLVLSTTFTTNPKEFKKDTEGGVKSLSSGSFLGKYLRNGSLWDRQDKLDKDEYNLLLRTLVNGLDSVGCIDIKENEDDHFSIQLDINCLEWELGDGVTVIPDKVRGSYSESDSDGSNVINKFFVKLYKDKASFFKRLISGEHTGQTDKDRREEREEKFRRGDLSALFCSPTMELGIDIADLASVNLRNVPPTPANYSQRVGRAGRSGQSAFISVYCSKGSGHDQYFFEKRDKMVAGVVEPPKLNLENEELILSHMNAIWLAKARLETYKSISEMLDLERDGYPLNDDIKNHINFSIDRIKECIKECKNVIKQCWGENNYPSWYSDEWLFNVIENAKFEFDKKFDIWRILYKNAYDQQQSCQDRLLAPNLNRDEQKDLERKIREAIRQKSLLENKCGGFEFSDFYPYRYLASEGFLPGYNFPRLPIRAFIKKKGRNYGDDIFISRPRFQAIREFGPQNNIYSEGHRYIVDGTLNSYQDIRFIDVKICKSCGTFYEGNDKSKEICDYCKLPLSDNNEEYIKDLMEMTNIRAISNERITSEEEERLRQGYEITTHFKFPISSNGDIRKTDLIISDKNKNPLLELSYSSSATLWRINRKWIRSKIIGFSIDKKTGRWKKGDDDDNTVSGVRIFVKDTRNILLIKPSITSGIDLDELINLQYALKKGICINYQVSESELECEIVGRGENSSILFWEAAEGGIGVLEILVDENERDTISNIAKRALEVCHFNEDGTEIDENNECSYACYRCLLTYYNQTNHQLLDRNLIKDTLLKLCEPILSLKPVITNPYDSIYNQCKTDFEKNFIESLYKYGYKLPDNYGLNYKDINYDYGFFYKNLKTFILCIDGELQGKNEVVNTLLSVGITVIEICSDKSLLEQIKENEDILKGGAS